MSDELKIEKKEQELVLSIKDVSIAYRVVRPISILDFLKGKPRKDKMFRAVNEVYFSELYSDNIRMIGK